MAWTAETVPEVFLTVDSTTERFSSIVGPLKSKENALVHVQVDFDPTPTSGCQVNVYKSADGVVFSTVAEPRRLVVSVVAALIEEAFIEVSGTPYFMVGVKGDGDTMDSVSISYARDGGLVAP